jgi:threonine dehydrogenase-like Zn-dependent dehydrogenase
MPRPGLLLAGLAAALASLVNGFTSSPRGACNAAGDTITVDVAVIGGGAAGSFAAVQLADVYKKSIVVIDTKDHLVRRRSSSRNLE